MGCTFSKRKFVVNSLIEGQDQAALNVLTELGLTSREIDVLYTAFWDMDADNSGTIQPIELCAYFEVELTRFEKGVFCLFDEDQSGLINFMEFVCAVWNILTLNETNMGCLAFMIADPTAGKLLTYTDIKELIECMHKKKIEKDPSMQEMMNYIKRDLSRAISVKDFTEWAHKYPSILTPLRMLQIHLRFQLIGPNFWTRMAEQRRAHPEMGRYDYITELQKRVIKETQFFMNRGEVNIHERNRLRRRGRGPEGDTRDVVTRKQSVLVKYFKLSRFSINRAGNNRVSPNPNQNTQSSDPHSAQKANHNNNTDVQHVDTTAKPRRRRSSFLFRRPNLLVISEAQPGGALKELSKKSSGKKHKKELYAEGQGSGKK